MADSNITEKSQNSKQNKGLGDDIYEEEMDLTDLDQNRPKKGRIWAIFALILTVSLVVGIWHIIQIEGSREPILVEYPDSFSDTNLPIEVGGEVRGASAIQGQFLGSRNGSKFHLPTCPGAKQIKEENKLWFSSRADAEARGYTPAANCPGI